MDISLGGIRTLVLDLRNWSSSGSDFNTVLRNAIRTAAAEIAAKLPNALLPDDEHVVLLADVKSDDTDVDARLKATTDRWVLEFTDTAGLVLGHPSSATTWRPTTDDTWDGIMHLEVKDPDGVWHRRQSRDWWSTTPEGGNETWYVSLLTRWQNATDEDMEFRIHQPLFFMRSDVHKLLAPSVIWDETRQQSWPLSAGTAFRQGMPDFRGESLNRPYSMYRGKGYQMPTPYTAPAVTLQGAWAGPWQEGTYIFLWTLCWGRKGDEWQELPGGLTEPIWESAPSPVSSAIDQSTDAGKAIHLVLPNIDAEFNFAEAGSLRAGHTGFYARIYVAQTAIYTSGGGQAAYNVVEAPGIYFPLADIDFDGGAATYDWDGSVIPDRWYQLRRATRYFGWAPYPHQDARYELDLRVNRLPTEFTDDQDTLPLHETFHPAFIALVMSYLCEMDGGDLKASAFYRSRFESLAEIPRDVDESPAEVVEPEPWGGDVGGVSQYGTFANET